MSGWQPIETAPKDGSRILLWIGHMCAAGYWMADADLPDGGSWEDNGRTPTHWMPLPEPPDDF